MKIAIPIYNDNIAPCFEAACHFLVATVDDRGKVEAEICRCSESGGIGRIRFIRDNDIRILICNGIKSHYRAMLRTAGLVVISDVGYPAREALNLYLNGKFGDRPEKILPSDYVCGILLEDLVCWTRDLFESHGYRIKCGNDAGPFPIDLIAEIDCPVCLNQIRVAICCGAHMYRPDKEIREFYHATGSNYHTRIYVHPDNSEMKDRCVEFGIELLDPYSDPSASPKMFASGVPLLQNVIDGHERAAEIKRLK